MVNDDKVAAEESDSSGYDEVVTTRFTKMIDAFSSCIIHVEDRYPGVGLNVIIQALCTADGS